MTDYTQFGEGRNIGSEFTFSDVWSLPETVLRGGYGVSYLPAFSPAYMNGFRISTPYVAPFDGGITPGPNRLRNPYPNGILMPPGRSQGLATMMGQGLTFGNPERTIPRVHTFSFGFEQGLPWRSVLEVSYVGTRTRQIETAKGINGSYGRAARPVRGQPGDLCAQSYGGSATRHGAEWRHRAAPATDASVSAVPGADAGSQSGGSRLVQRVASATEIRAESFNLLNSPWFGSPSTALASANAGLVTPSQSNDPRNVQLALRLTF